jgi:hypothetical protein
VGQSLFVEEEELFFGFESDFDLEESEDLEEAEDSEVLSALAPFL